QKPEYSLAAGVARSGKHRARIRQMGLRGENQSESIRRDFARLQDRDERATRSGLFNLASGMAVRSVGVDGVVIGFFDALHQDAGRLRRIGRGRRASYRRGTSVDRDKVSR